jgi:serine/threonine-protein kinase
MVYYEGESLASRLERGPLPIEEAARVAIEVARGPDTAHNAGITHRDIKPANVMLTPSGGV